jgi:hypothetical protein
VQDVSSDADFESDDEELADNDVKADEERASSRCRSLSSGKIFMQVISGGNEVSVLQRALKMTKNGSTP